MAAVIHESLRPYLSDIPYFAIPGNQMVWHRDHAEIPMFTVAAYLFIVWKGQEWMKDRKPFALKVPMAIWNFSLALFSWIGAICVVPVVIETISKQGYRFTVCAPPFLWSAGYPTGPFVGLFIYSKIPELLDTVFLILRKRPVIFLHWYHHVTVLLYCWHAWHHSVGAGIWFSAINYSVHALMYTYYFCTNVGLYHLVRPIAPVITTLQLSQMFLGVAILISIAYYVWTSTEEALGDLSRREFGMKYNENACYIDNANLKLGLAMYGTYFVLFAMFFWQRYVVGGEEEKKEPHKKAD